MSLIRMNIYRFIKTKSVYILLLITAIIVGLLTMDQISGAAAVDYEIMQQAGIDMEESAVGITLAVTPVTSVGVMSTELIGSGIVLVFTAIFAALFHNAERAGGYLKNLNSCAGAKEQVFFAKVIPVMLYVLLNLLIIPLVVKVLGMPGMDILTKDFMIYMVVEWLLHTAYGIFVLMIMEVTRNLVAGILSGIFVGMGVSVMLIGFVENAFHGNGIISGHMLVQMARVLTLENIMSSLIPALITGVISFVLYLVIGTLTFKKKDIY